MLRRKPPWGLEEKVPSLNPLTWVLFSTANICIRKATNCSIMSFVQNFFVKKSVNFILKTWIIEYRITKLSCFVISAFSRRRRRLLCWEVERLEGKEAVGAPPLTLHHFIISHENSSFKDIFISFFHKYIYSSIISPFHVSENVLSIFEP